LLAELQPFWGIEGDENRLSVERQVENRLEILLVILLGVSQKIDSCRSGTVFTITPPSATPFEMIYTMMFPRHRTSNNQETWQILDVNKISGVG